MDTYGFNETQCLLPLCLLITGIGDKYDEKTQEPNYGSDDPYHKDAVVMYYVTPALYHANNLMVKGKVVTEILR